VFSCCHIDRIVDAWRRRVNTPVPLAPWAR